MEYANICKKLGFDPIKDGYDYGYKGHEDDSKPSPFSILTYQEVSFLADYLIAHRDEIKKSVKAS